MTISDYILLLNKPDAVHEKQTAELEKIVQEFPYFQSARALHLKGLYNQNSFKYNYALKVTAAHTIDRSVLFDFITSDVFAGVDRKTFEEKLSNINDIKVQESEIINEETSINELVIEEIPDEHIFETAVAIQEDVFAEDELVSDDDDLQDEDLEQTEVSQIVEPEIVQPQTEDEAEEFEEDVFVQQPQIPVDKLEQSILNSIRVSSPTIETGEEVSEEIVESELEEVEPEALEIGKPLNFESRETHSFQEWLQLSQMKPIDRSAPIEKAPEEDDRQKKNDLIDRFIKTNPKIPPIKSDGSKSTNSVFEASNDPDRSYLMTETLARVYLEQHKYQKAIQAYEILILKYPEKSSFFADRILDIKNLQQK